MFNGTNLVISVLDKNNKSLLSDLHKEIEEKGGGETNGSDNSSLLKKLLSGSSTIVGEVKIGNSVFTGPRGSPDGK